MCDNDNTSHNTATYTKEVVVVSGSSLDQGGPREDVGHPDLGLLLVWIGLPDVTSEKLLLNNCF